MGSELSLSLSPPISFGFSFSNGFDVDSNGYPGKTVYMIYVAQIQYLICSTFFVESQVRVDCMSQADLLLYINGLWK